ncbi:MAG: flagellar biosynthetic protein FliO [Bryobacteraceae bacterium]
MEGIRQVLAVSGVLLLMGASLWWLRCKGMARLGGLSRHTRQRHMQVLERVVLGPQHSLHLVQVAGRALVVGVSPAGCQLLQSIDGSRLACDGLVGAREANG